jgi:hypothetical protein
MSTTRFDLAKRYGVSRQTINEWRGQGAPVDDRHEMDSWVHRNRPERYPWTRMVDAEQRMCSAAEDLVDVVPDDELAEQLLQFAWCCLIRRPEAPRIDLDDLRDILAATAIDQPANPDGD